MCQSGNDRCIGSYGKFLLTRLAVRWITRYLKVTVYEPSSV